MENQKYLTPQNQKSLYASLCKVFADLMNDEIDYRKANAAAALVSQANSIIKTELARTALQMKMEEMGNLEGRVRLREIESKGFSNTMTYTDAPEEDIQVAE